MRVLVKVYNHTTLRIVLVMALCLVVHVNAIKDLLDAGMKSLICNKLIYKVGLIGKYNWVQKHSSDNFSLVSSCS